MIWPEPIRGQVLTSILEQRTSLPKATALGTYSYRLSRGHDQALLAALGPALVGTGQAGGTEFDLDFHAIMHFGDDVALETHYVPRRSQRTESVLTFFAQDGATRNLVYANAGCTKATQADEALAFARRGFPGTLPDDSMLRRGTVHVRTVPTRRVTAG
jgi:hypothetical protein